MRGYKSTCGSSTRGRKETLPKTKPPQCSGSTPGRLMGEKWWRETGVLTSFIAYLILLCLNLPPKHLSLFMCIFHSMHVSHLEQSLYFKTTLYRTYIVLLGNPPMHCKFFVLLQKLTFLLIRFDNNVWIKDTIECFKLLKKSS